MESQAFLFHGSIFCGIQDHCIEMIVVEVAAGVGVTGC